MAIPQIPNKLGNVPTAPPAVGSQPPQQIPELQPVAQPPAAQTMTATAAPTPPAAPAPPMGSAQLPQFQQYADATFQEATRRLDPRFQQAEARFRQDMVNRGISEGTEAFDKAFKNFSMDRNDAYAQAQNQALLSGLGAQNQAFGQTFQTQRADMQDLMALLGYGSSVNQQNNSYLNQDFNRAGGLFGLVPGMSPVQVDVMGPYQMQQQAWAQQAGMANQNANGLWGGLGALGSAFMLSDARLKTDAQRVGTLDNGLPVYAYRYAAGGPVMLGLMAQDVQQVRPEAVAEFDGFLAVNYEEAVR